MAMKRKIKDQEIEWLRKKFWDTYISDRHMDHNKRKSTHLECSGKTYSIYWSGDEAVLVEESGIIMRS